MVYLGSSRARSGLAGVGLMGARVGQDLLSRRQELASRRAAFSSGEEGSGTAGYGVISADVLSSWERCTGQVSSASLPDSEPLSGVQDWADSPIGQAEGAISELADVARNEGYLAAIVNRSGHLLWTAGSDEMLRQADKANFVPGSDWSEAAAGTNAPCLSLDLDRPALVFSEEHWCEPVHDWVCYAAPIHDASGAVVGCVDLSSTWQRATSMAAVVVRSIANQVDAELRTRPGGLGLQKVRLKLMGKPRLTINGHERALPPRQIEILAALALFPDGLSLGELKHHVYGDRPVSSSTVKAEVSHLRSVLGGRIKSRPYRLTVPVAVDVLDIYKSTRSKNLNVAMSAYVDQLMPRSEAPLLVGERHSIDVALRSALLKGGSVADLLRFSKVNPYDREILEVARFRIEPESPLHPELMAAFERFDSFR